MKRKVSRMGPSSLVVSLPSKWAKKQGLKKGDEIDVEEKETGLLLTTKGAQVAEKTKLQLKSSEPFKKRYILNLYRAGVDEIEVTSEEPLPFSEIQEALNDSLGFEIVDQGQKFCLIKSVSSSLDTEFDVILRRVFLLNLTMGKDIVDALRSKQPERLAEISNMEHTIDKFVNFCVRILTKYGYKSKQNELRINNYVMALEQIGDMQHDLCDLLRQKKATVAKELIQFMQRMNILFEEIYHLFYKFEKNKVAEVKRERQKLYQEMAQLTRNKATVQSEALLLLAVMLNLLHHMEVWLVP
jgi:phosphate uptake regulator